MSFNLGPSFSRKIHKVYQLSTQKHLGIHLDEGLTFKHHKKINKANKGFRIICKLNNILPCYALLTTCRSFVRPDLDYGDVIYYQAENESVSSKIERVQYNASLAITGAIKRNLPKKAIPGIRFGITQDQKEDI